MRAKGLCKFLFVIGAVAVVCNIDSIASDEKPVSIKGANKEVAGVNSEVRRLNWATCVELTVQNSAELKAAYQTLESTEADERGSASGFYPQLSASVGATQSNGTTPSQNLVPIDGSTTSYSASVTASQNIFSGFLDAAKLARARATTKAAESALQISKAKMSYDLKSTYEDLRYAQEFRNLTADIIRRREDNLKMVELKFKSGLENKGSVLLSRAYLNDAQFSDLQAANVRTVAMRGLARSLGIDDGTTELFAVDEIPTHEPSPLGGVQSVRDLASHTPSLAQSAAQVASAYQSVRVARAGFFPSLSLTGQAGKTDTKFFPDSNRWSIGATLTIPLFSGFSDRAATDSASARWMAAESTRMNLLRDLVTQITQAYARYQEAVVKLGVDQSYLEAAKVRAEIARNKYNNGLMSFDDWDVIETDLINRQKTYLQSLRDRVIAEAAWEQTEGRGAIP